MDTRLVSTQEVPANHDCVVKLHRLQKLTEIETPSMKRELRRSQRIKRGQQQREWKSPDKIKVQKNPVKRKRTREDNHNCEEDSSSGHQHLSEYELQRLENIRQNKAFLCFLELPKAIEAMRTKPKPSRRAIKKVKAVEVLPPRKSVRLLKKDTEALPLSKAAAAGPVDTVPCKPAAPIPMSSLHWDEGNGRLHEALLKLWTENNIKQDQDLPDLKRYRAQLKMMSIDANAVMKVVKSRTLCAAFHPCSSSLLMAAGDSSGHIGLWNMGANWGDNGVLLFKPHSRPVGWLAFSSTLPSNLVSLSCDGSAHSMDLERALFEEVYSSDSSLKSFDFLSVDCSTLLIAHSNGHVVLVDRRTPGTSYEWLCTLDPKKLSSVHVHPLQRQYFVAAESRSVNIYDCRHMKRNITSPVCKLKDHSSRISSAFFSPCTGNRVLTTWADGKIRVFDTTTLVNHPHLVSSSKNTQLKIQYRARAVWDPKQEDCFVIGSMASRPRQIQVRHERGRRLRSFEHAAHMTAVCPVTAFHPNRHALLAASGSGRLHVFSCSQ